MNKKKTNIFNYISLLIIFFINIIHANGPQENYHVSYEELSNETLTNISGILTINSGVKGGEYLRIYNRSDSKFEYIDSLYVKKETIPVSNYGYGKYGFKTTVQNYRYPIIDTLNNYYLIVYDCKKDFKAWVSVDEINENYYTTIIMLDKLVTSERYYVDLFFCICDEINVYKTPSFESDSFKISKNEYKYFGIKIVNQKGNWVEIVKLSINYDTDQLITEPIGWVILRNEKNQIVFWIKLVDYC